MLQNWNGYFLLCLTRPKCWSAKLIKKINKSLRPPRTHTRTELDQPVEVSGVSFLAGQRASGKGRDDQLVSPQGTWCRRVSEEATKRWAHAPNTRGRRTTINQKKSERADTADEPKGSQSPRIRRCCCQSSCHTIFFSRCCHFYSLLRNSLTWLNEQLLLSASALSSRHLPRVFLHAHALHANRNTLMQRIMGVFEKPQSFWIYIYIYILNIFLECKTVNKSSSSAFLYWCIIPSSRRGEKMNLRALNAKEIRCFWVTFTSWPRSRKVPAWVFPLPFEHLESNF